MRIQRMIFWRLMAVCAVLAVCALLPGCARALGSSNPLVATVLSGGSVTGVNIGTARIMASTSNGKTDYYDVTVEPEARGHQYACRLYRAD